MTTTVYGREDCTGADGSGISNRNPTVGFGPWENSIGCFASGASVQSNRYEKTAIASGGMVLHNMMSGSLMPNDSLAGSSGLEYSWDLWRPDSAVAGHGSGIIFRGDGGQFNAATADQIVVYWIRVSDSLVDLFLRVTENAVPRQQVTVKSNFAWTRNTAMRLGVVIVGANITVWTEPQGGGTRTIHGVVALTPTTLNDGTHKLYGVLCNQGFTAGYKFDNGLLREQYLPTAPGVPAVVVVGAAA